MTDNTMRAVALKPVAWADFRAEAVRFGGWESRPFATSYQPLYDAAALAAARAEGYKAGIAKATADKKAVAWQRRVINSGLPVSDWIHCDEWDVEMQRKQGNEVRALAVLGDQELDRAIPQAYCNVCEGAGTISTGIGEASSTQCHLCEGTGYAIRAEIGKEG